ncbi:MAG TPA: cytochrome c [Bryobacteraceae bacterium]
MTRSLLWASACLWSSLTTTVCLAANTAQIDRGRYLVEEIAKCSDCHTPRLASGQLDRSKWLKGATLDFKPIADVPGWQTASPDVTSTSYIWKNWGKSGVFKLLTTGLAPNGRPARPPMPAFKMKPADARAVIAYLKSLK